LLTRELSHVFAEDQTYRIDHYLGKEVIQNLLVLRFANLVFEPLWNHHFIKSVSISWKEDLGIEGRGGYFDQYGIIRDVMQNHLTQILSLVAMEPSEKLTPASIAGAKVGLLRSVLPLKTDDIVLGQYRAGKIGDRAEPAYVDDDTVPDDSNTPTFAAVRLWIQNERWEGVPFIMTAGKGLDSRITEIRIRFRGIAGNMFCNADGCPDANELVIRVQPDEAIYLRFVNKVPGIGVRFATKDLDLHYDAAFDEVIPDAYESLILDVIKDDKSLFITNEELQAAWNIFTPVLHDIETRRMKPVSYKFGSSGPSIMDLGLQILD